MSKNILTVILFVGLLVTVTASVSADPAADYYLDPTHWKNMDWGQPGTSPLWQLPGWEADLEKLSSGGTRIKKRTIVIDGIKFDANWSTAKANDKRSLISGFISTNLSSKECLQLAETLTLNLVRQLSMMVRLISVFLRTTPYTWFKSITNGT